MRGRQSRLFLAAVAIVGVLTALPATGWIVRRHLSILAHQQLPDVALIGMNGPTGIDPREVAAAAAHPNDFDCQVAIALQARGERDPAATDGTGRPDVRALLALRARFGDRPELYAHILRLLTTSDLKIRRGAEENVLWTSADRAKLAMSNTRPETPTSPAVIALAEDAARRGEALDPGNGYFPAMRAIALLAAKRDAEALKAIEDAGTRTTWNDYSAQAVRARWTLARDAYGETGALYRVLIAASVLLPHYSVLRDMARVSTALAVDKELAGDADGGFRIRRSIARLGALMRGKSANIIGGLVGYAITQMASAPPGGEPSVPHQPTDTQHATREARYVSYLTRIGHPEEAAWYVAETKAGATVQRLSQALMPADGPDDVVRQLYCLVAWWAAGVLLLMNTLWLLAAGCLSALLSRKASIRAGQPLRYQVHVSGIIAAIGLAAVLTGVLTVSLLNVMTVFAGFAGAKTPIAVATVVGAAGLLAFLLKRRPGSNRWQGFRELLKGVWALTVTLASVGLLIGASVQICGSLNGLPSVLNVLYDLTGAKSAQFDGDGLRVFVGAATLAVPILAAIVLAIRSRVLRVPVSVGVTRGMSSLALPIAAVLLFAYAATVVGTRVEESNVQAATEARLTNEGADLAAKAHETWPGPVATPPKAER